MNWMRFAAENFPAPESSMVWQDALGDSLMELDDWLSDPINVHDALAAVEEHLMRKHRDYGENNLKEFGELGILVRASDKVARLKNLIDKHAEVEDESRADTWRDLAGYAIQAMIMMKMSAGQANTFEIRKNRLIRGCCPDCGEGVLLRENLWTVRLRCSAGCGFVTDDLYQMHLSYPDFNAMIEALARQPVCMAQIPKDRC